MRAISAIALAGALGVGVLGAAAPAVAAGFHDLAAIDAEVAQFTGAPQGVSGGARQPVDRRLKLAQCPMPLAFEWYGNAHQTVLVRCPVTNGWRLFVPIEGASPGIKAEPVVARGEAVSIAIQGAGFTVSRQGEALDAGAVGEWIRVRPAGEKRESIRARVIQPGRVGIDLP